jgi:DNA-binding NtrC family response regulator
LTLTTHNAAKNDHVAPSHAATLADASVMIPEPQALKPRILFVDDEPEVLNALRLMLHRERSCWEMSFATSGAAALDELDRNPCDAVVSDMRMPEMDGEKLLLECQLHHPRTARVLLTGYSDADILERLRPILHGLLAKPCERTRLREAILRAIDTASAAVTPPSDTASS